MEGSIIVNSTFSPRCVSFTGPGSNHPLSRYLAPCLWIRWWRSPKSIPACFPIRCTSQTDAGVNSMIKLNLPHYGFISHTVPRERSALGPRPVRALVPGGYGHLHPLKHFLWGSRDHDRNVSATWGFSGKLSYRSLCIWQYMPVPSLCLVRADPSRQVPQPCVWMSSWWAKAVTGQDDGHFRHPGQLVDWEWSDRTN